MTPEEFFIEYLNENMDGVQAYGDEPDPAPPFFLTVEQVGGGGENTLGRADIAVQSWAPTRAEAGQLNARVIAAMRAAAADPRISKCHLDTSYNFTDTTKKRPRYQAVFEVVHFLEG
jgi:hypothetical protein